MKKPKSTSLSKQLLSGIVILCILSLAVAFVIVNTTVRSLVYENIISINQRDKALQATQLDGWLRMNIQIVDDFSTALLNMGLEHIYVLEVGLMDDHPFLDGVYLGFSDGGFSGFWGWDPGPDWDSTTRPWYIDAVAAQGQTVITKPYVSRATGGLVTAVARDLGEIDGLNVVMATDVHLWYITDLIERVEVAGGGYLFIVDADGYILAHPNSYFHPNLYKFYNVDEIYGNGTRGISQSTEDIIRAESYRGITSYLIPAPLESVEWSLIAVIPTTVASNPVWTMLSTVMLIIVFALTMVAVFTFFFVRRVATTAAQKERELEREARIAAEESNKAKSEFLSKMSHEIRTPMNAILGMAQLILREDISSTARDQAVTIKHSGDHLLSIVNDILDLSKVESGKMELINNDYLFHSTVYDVVNIIKMRMQNPKVKFVAYLQHDIPNALVGDEVRVRQILLNVLTNALKYTNEGYFSLEISGEPLDDCAMMLFMKIKDTGIGMKSEDLKQIFSEFTQFNVEKNRSVEGTGLGLAITYSLIKLMGGDINVSSVYGEGSEFTIRLPVQLGKKSAVSDYGKWPPRFDNERVLLYGSTPIYIEYAARTLRDLQVEFNIIKSDSDLIDRLNENSRGYVFAEEGLAEVAQNIVSTRGLATKVVIMSDSYKSQHNMPVLIMPAYLISISNVLSGRYSMYSADRQHIEHFVAPDAKVMIVDDIETNLKVGEGLLKPYGMVIKTCLSGKEALAAIAAEEYDLILMDHMMPEMDGVETVKAIRGLTSDLDERYATVPIIALTANAIMGVREMFLQNGFNGFLSKPIELTKLNSILSEWIPKEKQKPADLDAIKGISEEIPKENRIAIHIPGVDTARGIARSGGSVKGYLDILATFQKDGLERISKLTNCLKNSNMTLYSTYVHGLRSVCANIGADKFSEEVKILEDASANRDIDFITRHNDEFIAGLKRLLDNIGTAIDVHSEKSDDNKIIDENALKVLLARLKAAVERFDVASIDDISEKLQDFTQAQGKGQILRDMLQNIYVSKYKQALTQIDELQLLQNQEQ